eukprot:2668972-Pleurochrysis_carterae.AAC.1
MLFLRQLTYLHTIVGWCQARLPILSALITKALSLKDLNHDSFQHVCILHFFRGPKAVRCAARRDGRQRCGQRRIRQIGRFSSGRMTPVRLRDCDWFLVV